MKVSVLWCLWLKVFTAVNSLPSYEYVGCFIDNRERALGWHKDESNDQTIERCIDICDGFDAPYAGLQHRDQCFCGHDFDLHGRGDESSCRLTCKGNSQQICGGNWRSNVFRIVKWTRFIRDPAGLNNPIRTGIPSNWTIYAEMEVLDCAMECSRLGECWSFFHDNTTAKCFTQTLPEFTPRLYVKANTFCSDC